MFLRTAECDTDQRYFLERAVLRLFSEGHTTGAKEDAMTETGLTVTPTESHGADSTLDTEDLTLDGLDQIEAVVDDDDLPGDEPGLELSAEVDPGGTPEPVVPEQGGRT
jgi:hypothetical protein